VIGPIDWARARRDAAATLATIDWSRRDVLIWAQGTTPYGKLSTTPVDPAYAKAVESRFGVRASAIRLQYDAGLNIRQSVATGAATLKLVLAGIAAHTGDHRIFLIGVSQGAWVHSEALADPVVRGQVTRAVLLGHPSLAAHHYADDDTVVEINHANDQTTQPLNGDPNVALDAFAAMTLPKLSNLDDIWAGLKENPRFLLQEALVIGAFLMPWWFKSPHNYTPDMAAAVDYLADGTKPAAVGDAALAAARLRPAFAG